jgi:tRNA(Arg) A34 adenosine deaminase TadA
VTDYLTQAAEVARSEDPDNDHREAWVGAIGIRADGVVVSARNEAVFDTGACGTDRTWSFPPAHAENRLCKKLDTGAEVYVARTRKDGTIGMARPCTFCERVLRSRGVKKVYYTVDGSTYGAWDLETNDERTITR